MPSRSLKNPDVASIEVEPIKRIDFAVKKNDGSVEFIEAKSANGVLHERKLERYIISANDKFSSSEFSNKLDFNPQSDERVLTISAGKYGMKREELGSSQSSVEAAVRDRINDLIKDPESDVVEPINIDEVRIVTTERIYVISVDS